VRKKIFFFTLFFIFITPLKADLKENIIINLEKINNLSFDFEQTINEKTETGNCVIKYPKKIYCAYNNFNKKIMVSDGNSLVIINQKSNQYYRYPIEKTRAAKKKERRKGEEIIIKVNNVGKRKFF